MSRGTCAAGLAFGMLVLMAGGLRAGAAEGRHLVFCCRPDNDLYRACGRAARRKPARYDTAEAAIAAARPGAGLLVLADGYPDRTTAVAPAALQSAAEKGVRVYIEYPAGLPGIDFEAPRGIVWERGVVSSDRFGGALPRHSILAIHGCRFVPARSTQPWIVLARVAGFDRAVYGLPATTFPVLYEARPGLLVSTTKLSQFVTARYGPTEAWKAIWQAVLEWLEPGGPGHSLAWEPAVRPAYSPDARLPSGAEARALRRGIDWFSKARMLVHPSWAKVYDDDAEAWPDRLGPMPRREWPAGDGSLGLLEGFSSSVNPDGTQPVRWWRRNDCNGEIAGAMALAGKALRDDRLGTLAGNIGDWLYTRSILSQGKRSDPADPAYGLIGWNDVTRYYGDLDGYGVYYGDDNARSMLGMMAAAALLRTDRWDTRLARCLLANLRLAGQLGFQPDRIDEGPLERAGWRAYHEARTVSLAPHYQAYLWACYLWAYRHSGYRPFLDRAKTAIGMTMAAYPGRWQWTNGIQQERAKMMLPLAWLVRVEDTEEHRAWLRRVTTDLLSAQAPCGALREQLGQTGLGGMPPPPSNEAYGTAEASLIQTDGDPVCCLLYTSNFAFLGLHEAAAATGEPLYGDAERRLAEFVCRIQIRSRSHPELDGGWFRAFDFGRWEYWGSNADAGWGVWCIESGWTQSWITSVLAMRRLRASLWDLTASSSAGRAVAAERPALLPDEPAGKTP